MRCKPGQNTDLFLREAARARRRPAGVEGVDILYPHRLPDAIDDRQIVRLAGIAQVLDRRKAARFARFEPAAQGRFTPPQHLQKRAALPQLRSLALTARRVFFFAEADRLVLVPEEAACLMHRVQRVDHHERFAERQPRFDTTLAEALYQRTLAADAKQPGLREPGGNFIAIPDFHCPTIASRCAAKAA